MGGRGAGSVAGNSSYVRFGAVPESGYSLNYFKLRGSESSDIAEWMDEGKSLLEAIALSVKDYENRDIFESGVSVFKKDKNGMPEITSLQQLESLLSRKDSGMYSMFGKQSGIGSDGEPVISGVKGVKKVSMSSDKLDKHIELTLQKNYGKSEKSSEPGNYVDKEYVRFNGKKYTKPRWNTSRGYGEHGTTKDSGVRLSGGDKYVQKPYKSLVSNISHFTSKKGVPMVSFTHEGVKKTMTLSQFEKKTETVRESTPLKITKKK